MTGRGGALFKVLLGITTGGLLPTQAGEVDSRGMAHGSRTEVNGNRLRRALRAVVNFTDRSKSAAAEDARARFGGRSCLSEGAGALFGLERSSSISDELDSAGKTGLRADP